MTQEDPQKQAPSSMGAEEELAKGELQESPAPESADRQSICHEGVQSPFGAFVSIELTGKIPEDPASESFAESILAMRRFFEDRYEYSAFICEQLALRGVPPNTSNVATIGKWGSRRDVSNDVKSWYAKLLATIGFVIFQLLTEVLCLPQSTSKL